MSPSDQTEKAIYDSGRTGGGSSPGESAHGTHFSGQRRQQAASGSRRMQRAGYGFVDLIMSRRSVFLLALPLIPVVYACFTTLSEKDRPDKVTAANEKKEKKVAAYFDPKTQTWIRPDVWNLQKIGAGKQLQMVPESLIQEAERKDQARQKKKKKRKWDPRKAMA